MSYCDVVCYFNIIFYHKRHEEHTIDTKNMLIFRGFVYFVKTFVLFVLKVLILRQFHNPLNTDPQYPEYLSA